MKKHDVRELLKQRLGSIATYYDDAKRPYVAVVSNAPKGSKNALYELLACSNEGEMLQLLFRAGFASLSSKTNRIDFTARTMIKWWEQSITDKTWKLHKQTIDKKRYMFIVFGTARFTRLSDEIKYCKDIRPSDDVLLATDVYIDSVQRILRDNGQNRNSSMNTPNRNSRHDNNNSNENYDGSGNGISKRTRQVNLSQTINADSPSTKSPCHKAPRVSLSPATPPSRTDTCKKRIAFRDIENRLACTAEEHSNEVAPHEPRQLLYDADIGSGTIDSGVNNSAEQDKAFQLPAVEGIKWVTSNVTVCAEDATAPTGQVKASASLDEHIIHGFVEQGCYLSMTKRKSRKEYSYYVSAIPNGKVLVDKAANTKKLADLEDLKEKNEKAAQFLERKRYKMAEILRRKLGGALATQPKMSALGLEQLLPLIICAIFTEAGQPITMEQAANFMPSRTTIDHLIDDFGVDSMLVTADALAKQDNVYISFDKGDASKGGLGGCAKILSYWDAEDVSEEYPDGRVKVVSLDADKCDDSAEDVANCVVHSCKKTGVGLKLAGTTNDSGGAVLESVSDKLAEGGVMKEDPLIANCTLHNLNLELAVPMQNVLMSGNQSTDKQHIKRDVEQLLFAAFATEQNVGFEASNSFWDTVSEHVHGADIESVVDEEERYFLREIKAELKALQDDRAASIEADDEPDNEPSEDAESNKKETRYRRMLRGVLTRWFSVGEAAILLKDTIAMRKMLARQACKMSGKKTKETAQTFLSLSRERRLLCDLELVASFYSSYFKPHFVWFQGADKLVKKPAFQAFTVFARAFLMHQEHERMADNGWKTLPAFKPVVDWLDKIDEGLLERFEPEDETALAGSNHESPESDQQTEDQDQNTTNAVQETPRQAQERKINMFFKESQDEHNKMFERWVLLEKLGFLGCLGETKLGKIMCQVILGIEPSDQDLLEEATQEYCSEIHDGRMFNLDKFRAYVKDLFNERDVHILNSPHIKKNLNLMRLIANGLDIWKGTSPLARFYRASVLKQYAALISNNQGTERANKDQNLAAANGRLEEAMSIRIAAQQHLREITSVKQLDGRRPAYRGKKPIIDRGERIMYVVNEIRRLQQEQGPEKFAENRKAMKERLHSPYKSVRQAKKDTAFKAALLTKHKESAREKEAGVDFNKRVDGYVQFGRLNTVAVDGKPNDNVKLLSTELRARFMAKEIEPAEVDTLMKSNKGITALKSAIRVDEKSRGGIDYDDRFFKPLHTNVSDYTLAKARRI